MSRRNSLIDPATIVASGPGLSGGRVGEECKFRIDGTDGGMALSFHIEGPSRPIFETCAGTDMSLDISYIPLLPVSTTSATQAQSQPLFVIEKSIKMSYSNSLGDRELFRISRASINCL